MVVAGLLFVAVVAAAVVVILLQTKKAPTEMRARAANACAVYNKGEPVPKVGVSGTIQSKKEDQFVLTVGGATSKIIMVCAGATITNKSNAKLTYADLKVGDKATVGGYYGDNTATTILATTITQNSKTPTPTPFPTPIVKQALYYNLSMILGTSSVSYSFTYTGPPAKNFYVALSTDPKMLTDVYIDFAEGPKSPVTQNNPSKWDKYTCDRPLYWRVTTEHLKTGWASYKPELMSDIASGTVACQ